MLIHSLVNELISGDYTGLRWLVCFGFLNQRVTDLGVEDKRECLCTAACCCFSLTVESCAIQIGIFSECGNNT